jgi:uncharacterized Fe-S cluster protein YjdI
MDKYSIEFRKNGSIKVSNLKSIIIDEKRYEVDKEHISLCRCGNTSNSPYCDATHKQTDFSDEQIEAIDENFKDYFGKHIIISYNKDVCAHVGYCTKYLNEVFNVHKRPWINPDEVDVERIIEVIKKCPSGALKFTLSDEEYDEFSTESYIYVEENGPLHLKGNFELLHDIKPISKDHCTLCRCGLSLHKPYCDGKHYSKEYK